MMNRFDEIIAGTLQAPPPPPPVDILGPLYELAEAIQRSGLSVELTTQAVHSGTIYNIECWAPNRRGTSKTLLSLVRDHGGFVNRAIPATQYNTAEFHTEKELRRYLEDYARDFIRNDLVHLRYQATESVTAILKSERHVGLLLEISADEFKRMGAVKHGEEFELSATIPEGVSIPRDQPAYLRAADLYFKVVHADLVGRVYSLVLRLP